MDRRDPAMNAAPHYWRAFQWESVPLPKGHHTNAFNLLREASQGTFTEQTVAFLARTEPYLEWMRTGANQPYCDWGMAEEPSDVLLYLSAGRSLVNLVVARFHHLIASEREHEALSLLESGFQFCRHMDDGRFLMPILMRITSEATLINAAGEELPRITVRGLTRLEEWWNHHNWRQDPEHLSATYRADYSSGISRVAHLDAISQLSPQELDDLNRAIAEIFGLQNPISDEQEWLAFLSELKEQIDHVASLLNQRGVREAYQTLERLANQTEGSLNQALLESARDIARSASQLETRAELFHEALILLMNGEGGITRNTLFEYDFEPQFRDRFKLTSRDGSPANQVISLQVGRIDSVEKAAADGDMEQLEYLVRTGARLNRRDARGWFPLHHAAKTGRREVVELFLKHQADINAVALQGDHRPLIPRELAARYGLKQPDFPENEDPRTALDIARQAGHGELAEYLVNQGAKSARELFGN